MSGNDKMTKESFCEQDTFRMGEELGEKAVSGEIYLLDGDLGAGKTVFTKGFAKGLGIKEPVTSPTFTILQEYHDGRIPLYHFDVYRISCLEEMEEIGYEECFYGEGVCLIEWPSLIRELLPRESICVSIKKDMEKGFDYRRIRIGNGEYYENSGT